jgi:hypothetical protein
MLETDRDQFGNFIQALDRIPSGSTISSWIPIPWLPVWRRYHNGINSTIYAVQFGEEGSLRDQSGRITVNPSGHWRPRTLPTRIKWYCSLALFSAIKAAALIGVQD